MKFTVIILNEGDTLILFYTCFVGDSGIESHNGLKLGTGYFNWNIGHNWMNSHDALKLFSLIEVLVTSFLVLSFWLDSKCLPLVGFGKRVLVITYKRLFIFEILECLKTKLDGMVYVVRKELGFHQICWF